MTFTGRIGIFSRLNSRYPPNGFSKLRFKHFNSFSGIRYSSGYIIGGKKPFEPEIDTRRLALYFFPALCGVLGTWQIYRYYWKQDIISSMETGLNAPPEELDLGNYSLSKYENRRIIAKGKFLHEHETLVGPRNKGGPGRPGFYVYTPFLMEGGKIIMVNRGWIPENYQEKDSRRKFRPEIAFPEGEVQILGMIRQPKYYQPRSMLLPEPHVTSIKGTSVDDSNEKSNKWLWVDPGTMMGWLFKRLKLSHSTEELQVSNNATRIQDYFIEEVLDMRDDSEISKEMMRWYQEGERISHANETMPTLLASAKALQSDGRFFYGKPIISPPSINVPNKHADYIITWFSLAALLLVTIWHGNRRKGIRKSQLFKRR